MEQCSMFAEAPAWNCKAAREMRPTPAGSTSQPTQDSLIPAAELGLAIVQARMLFVYLPPILPALCHIGTDIMLT